MFAKIYGAINHAKMASRILQDENFRNLLNHPKVKKMLLNVSFQEAIKSKDYSKLIEHPEFRQILQDPEIANFVSSIRSDFIQS